jgi:predicted permease
MPRIPQFLRLPRRASRIRADIDEEIRFDIEMRAQDLESRGIGPREARERAAREFGDVDDTRRYLEEIDMQLEAEARRRSILEDCRVDLSIALRGIGRTPLFAAVVLITLALGIGANTAVFSVVRRVLVAPLPFQDPHQLYRLYTTPSSTGDHDKLSVVELTDLAVQSRSLAGLTWFGNYEGMTFADGDIAEAWQSVSVAPNFFSVLGVRPTVGRVFTAGDFESSAPAALMITHQVWTRYFGGDPAIPGRVVTLSGRSYTVVGVLPEHFVGPTFNAEVLRPLKVVGRLRNSQSARSRAWRSVARLKAGISLEQWRAELDLLRPRMQAAYPEIPNAGVFLPTPLHEAVVGGAGAVLRFIMGAALVVLLAACVNIAGLFLSRAIARQRELGVRAALGANRGRLIRQTVAETLLYALLGGLLGLLLAVVMKAALLHQIDPMLPRMGEVRIDPLVLVFAFASSLTCGVLFAVLPAVAATRVDVREALGDGGMRAASRSSSASRASRLLVCGQVACAVVLVVGAGLLMRTFRSIAEADVGYETTRHQATFYLSTGGRYQGPAQAGFYDAFLARVRAIPGVTAVGYAVTPPWNGVWRSVRFRPVAMDAAQADLLPSVALASTSTEYFAAAGIPIRFGRGFNSADRSGPPVVVISERMARQFWRGSSPIGRSIRVNFSGSASPDTLPAREIVGVVSDVRDAATSEPTSVIYVSDEQMQYFGNSFVVRTTGDAKPLLGLIRSAVRELDAGVPLLRPQTLDEVRSEQVRRQRVAMMLMAMFASLAILLAGLGLYGIMAYNVASRTRELGIRTALGASRHAILRLVLGDGFAMTFAGLAAGSLAALAASRAASSLLIGVKATDPISYLAAIGTLFGVATLACLIPARSATRVEPVEALRGE